MTPALQVVRPDGPLHRVGRVPDAWALAPWTYAGPDNTFGNRYDDPEGEYRVLYAAAQRRGAFLETLARFRADLQLIAELAGDRRRPGLPDARARVVPREWLETRCVGAPAPTACSSSTSRTRTRSPTCGSALGDAPRALRPRRPRRGRHPQAHPARAHAGDLALRVRAPGGVRRHPLPSRLGDELTNWGIFEGSEPDEILEENEIDRPRRSRFRLRAAHARPHAGLGRDKHAALRALPVAGDPRERSAEHEAGRGHDQAGRGVEHEVVAGGDDGERDQRPPQQHERLRPALRQSGRSAMLIANAKPTCSDGTAANAL